MLTPLEKVALDYSFERMLLALEIEDSAHRGPREHLEAELEVLDYMATVDPLMWKQELAERLTQR